MRLYEYRIECYHCDTETNLTILDDEEPNYCPMCGETAQCTFVDAQADSDD